MLLGRSDESSFLDTVMNPLLVEDESCIVVLSHLRKESLKVTISLLALHWAVSNKFGTRK